MYRRNFTSKIDRNPDASIAVGVSAVREEQGGRLGTTPANRRKVNSLMTSLIESHLVSTPLRIPKKKISKASQLLPGTPPSSNMLALGLQGLSTQNGSSQNGVRKPYIPAVPKTPEVKIRDLPFYPVKATLLRPTPLMAKDSAEQQQQSLSFYLSPEQAITVNNGRKVEANGMVVYKMHILLRFTKPSADNVQDDDFPRNLCLKVNNKVGKNLY